MTVNGPFVLPTGGQKRCPPRSLPAHGKQTCPVVVWRSAGPVRSCVDYITETRDVLTCPMSLPSGMAVRIRSPVPAAAPVVVSAASTPRRTDRRRGCRIAPDQLNTSAIVLMACRFPTDGATETGRGMTVCRVNLPPESGCLRAGRT